MTTTQHSSESGTVREVRVGDFFHESWGYDQTNADFYQVVRVSDTGKTVWLRHVATALVEDRGSGAEYVAPVADAFDAVGAGSRRDGMLKRLLRRSYDGEWTVNMTSYSNAYLWDCKPAYQTASGWGH